MEPNKMSWISTSKWVRIFAMLGIIFSLSLTATPLPAEAAVVEEGITVTASTFTGTLYLPLIQQQTPVLQSPAPEEQAVQPEESAPVPEPTTEPAPLPEIPAPDPLEAFAAQVADGEAGMVRGVYVDGVMALSVLQQPAGNAGYVYPQIGTATQFSLAANYGVTGLLAHNTSSGQTFFDLREGNPVAIVLGDGSHKDYQVTEILRYQALSPNSPTSNFVDLATGEQLTATQLFKKVYMGDDHVIFQTCIANEGISTWGRLFVIATPVEG